MALFNRCLNTSTLLSNSLLSLETNSAAAEAKNNPADCAAGYEAGKGLIELVDTGAGNVALIVAGYSAADTRAATGVVANYGDYELSGSSAEVTTATSTVKEVTATATTE